MRSRAWLVTLLLCWAGSATPASAAQEPDTLTQLLTEVRLLRQAMERSAEFASRTQLLTAQLSVQERRLSRAQSELESVESELQGISAEHPRYENIREELERALGDERDPERQQQMEFEQRQIQTQIDQNRAREAELSASRSRASEAVSIERDRYEDLDNRLYQLEREMARER